MISRQKLSASFVQKGEAFPALPSPELQRESLVTPNGLFFVRNHGNIPTIEIENYQLTVTGLVKKDLNLSFEDILEEFPKVNVIATLPCVDELYFESNQQSNSQNQSLWGKEAVRTANFSGIRLRHVLLAAGVNPETRFVSFSGLDDVLSDEEANNFMGIIPIQKAMSPEVILAYEMNDEPLLVEQGFPLRVIVPGSDGTMSVKWINEIRLISEAQEMYSSCHTTQQYPAARCLETKQQKEQALYVEPAVMAVICTPRDGETVFDELLIVEGYAFAVEGRPVENVELSTDEGKTWVEAKILKNDNPWRWCFWEAYLRLHPGTHQIIVKARDDEGNSNGIQKSNPHSIKIKIVEDD
jgi:sulfite oxidase